MPPAAPRPLLWAVPLVFIVHDAEEVATVAGWGASHADELPAAAHRFLPVSTWSFGVSVGLILAVLLLGSALDLIRLHRGKPIFWSVLVAATVIANGFTHVLQAIAFRGYTPGVVSAVVLVIPFGLWLYIDGLRRGWLTRRKALGLLAIGAVAQGPAAVLALLGGSILARL